MTREEQDSVIAGMVRERRAARTTLTCVEERLDQIRRALGRATAAAIRDNNWTWDGEKLTLTPASSGLVESNRDPLLYPCPREFAEALELRAQLTERIAELDRKLA